MWDGWEFGRFCDVILLLLITLFQDHWRSHDAIRPKNHVRPSISFRTETWTGKPGRDCAHLRTQQKSYNQEHRFAVLHSVK